MTVFAFRINATTLQILKNLARKERTTLSDLIRLAISQYLDNLIRKS
ncbi:ribbon-helix-helix protein, CopG family [Tolypothrix sp. VBCCA 56010]